MRSESPLPLPSSERALSSVAPDSATFSCPVSPLVTPKGESLPCGMQASRQPNCQLSTKKTVNFQLSTKN